MKMIGMNTRERSLLPRGSLGIVFVIVTVVAVSCRIAENHQTSPESTTSAAETHPIRTSEKSRKTISTTPASMSGGIEKTPSLLAEAIVPNVTVSVSSTEESTQEPRPIATLVLADTKDYMLLTSNNLLWHPNITNTIGKPFENMSFSRAPWSPDGTRLAMRLLKHDGLAILLVEDGSIEFLNETPPNADAPLWSPVGNYLLLSTETIDSQTLPRLAIYSLETEEVELETQPVELISLVGWSSDSSKIALLRWSSESEANGRLPVLEVMNLVSGEVQVYSNPGMDLWVNASWSPNDDKILLFGINPDLGFPEPGFLIYAYNSIDLIDLRSGQIQPLLVVNTSSSNVSDNELPKLLVNTMPWTPDGNSIIYSIQGKVCLLEISNRIEICPDELNNAIEATGASGGDYPAWSPTGNWIGFILSFPNRYGGPVAAIRPDGTEIRYTDIDSGEVTLFGPIWSPKR